MRSAAGAAKLPWRIRVRLAVGGGACWAGLRMQLVIEVRDVQDVAADALLVPVDGALCRLGGAPAAALRAALPADERDDELEYVSEALARLRPLAPGAARVIDGVARWSWLVVSAAYPHDVDGRTYPPAACAAMLRAAMPAAVDAASAAGAASLAMTVIGTAYRMPGDVAVRAQVDGLAAAAPTALRVHWTFRDGVLALVARAAAARVGLVAAG